MILTHVATECTSEGYPIGESYRRTAVVGLMTRDPGAEAGLVSPLEPTLISTLLVEGSPRLHVRKKSCSPWQRVKAIVSLRLEPYEASKTRNLKQQNATTPSISPSQDMPLPRNAQLTTDGDVGWNTSTTIARGRARRLEWRRKGLNITPGLCHMTNSTST